MKAARRHELQHNQLADWLGEKLEELRPYYIHIGVAAAAIVLAFVGYIWFFAGEDTSSASSWQAVFSAYGDTKVDEALKRAVENYPGKPASRWAQLGIADLELANATRQLTQNPKEAKDALTRAEKALQEAEAGATDKELLVRVHLNLAKLYETKNELDKAREYYKKVGDAEKDNDSVFRKAAAKGMERLKPGSDVGETLAWLKQQDLTTKSKPSSNPFDLGPPESLPERPNLNFPTDLNLGEEKPLDLDPLKPLGPSKPSVPEATKPGESKPEETKPEEAPKSDKPAEEKAAEKKSGEKPAEVKEPGPTKEKSKEESAPKF